MKKHNAESGHAFLPAHVANLLPGARGRSPINAHANEAGRSAGSWLTRASRRPIDLPSRIARVAGSELNVDRR